MASGASRGWLKSTRDLQKVINKKAGKPKRFEDSCKGKSRFFNIY